MYDLMKLLADLFFKCMFRCKTFRRGLLETIGERPRAAHSVQHKNKSYFMSDPEDDTGVTVVRLTLGWAIDRSFTPIAQHSK